jgi:hypothetical protein
MIAKVAETQQAGSAPTGGTEEKMMVQDLAVFDADSHVVEPPALWKEYLDPDYRASANTPCRDRGSPGAI